MISPGAWISKLLSEGDGTPSTKRVLFSLAVVSAVAFAGGDICAARALTDHAVSLLQTALLYTAGAYGAGRFAEAAENSKTAP